MYEADRVRVAAGVLHIPAAPTQGDETYASNKCLLNYPLCRNCFSV